MTAVPAGETGDKVAEVVRAIYDAVDPLSGDSVGTVIHLSDHLFWDDRVPGDTDIERQLEAVRIVCRAAATAAIAALTHREEEAERRTAAAESTTRNASISAGLSAVPGDHATTPAAADNIRISDLLEEAERRGMIVRDTAVRALQIIRDHTDPDGETNYRADDREGCLDGVFSEASRALDYIAKVEVAMSQPSVCGKGEGE